MLVQALFEGPIDVVGDVHGELPALQALIAKLGYTPEGIHPEGRRLVFAGDLVDRGPYSPETLHYVMALVKAGKAQMVAGNHELNFLKKDYHEGTGWSYWAHCPKEQKFEPCSKATPEDLATFHDFLNNLPLMLVNDSMAVVHASYSDEAATTLAECPEQTILGALNYFKVKRDESAVFCDLQTEATKAFSLFDELDDSVQPPEHVHKLLADYYYVKQLLNPITYTLAGREVKTPEPFYIGGKWRFVRRDPWWRKYEEEKQVVIGHYWRTPSPSAHDFEKLFYGVSPYGWMGPRANVFCIDYSVGRRYQDRHKGLTASEFTTQLCALRLPEKRVYTETGEVHATSK